MTLITKKSKKFQCLTWKTKMLTLNNHYFELTLKFWPISTLKITFWQILALNQTFDNFFYMKSEKFDLNNQKIKIFTMLGLKNRNVDLNQPKFWINLEVLTNFDLKTRLLTIFLHEKWKIRIEQPKIQNFYNAWPEKPKCWP